MKCSRGWHYANQRPCCCQVGRVQSPAGCSGLTEQDGSGQMPIDATPVRENFGAEITGVDLTRPVDGESMAWIEEMLNRYAVLIFPDQPVNDEQQIALTRLFGPLESNPGYAGGKMFRREEVADFTNVAGDNSLME